MLYIIDFLRDLADWTESFADTEWAVAVLSAIAFSESIIFPIPPDPLLIALGLNRPDSAIWLALLVTFCSVAGAILGHWIGAKFGRPVLYRLISRHKIKYAERLFKKFGIWAILLSALTPIPYKVFTIMAGMMNMDMRALILVSILGRGLRFVTIGVLIFAFGDSIKSFIDDNLEVLTIGLGALIVAGAGGYFIYNRLHKSQSLVT